MSLRGPEGVTEAIGAGFATAGFAFGIAEESDMVLGSGGLDARCCLLGVTEADLHNMA
jgi:hypothetical protein